MKIAILLAFLGLILAFVIPRIWWMVSPEKLSETRNPVAYVKFNLEDYGYGIRYENFKEFRLFDGHDCSDCDFSEGGNMVLSRVNYGQEVNIAIYLGKRPDLYFFFYGDDPKVVMAEFRYFVDYLNDSEGFQRGFEINESPK